MSMTVEPTRRPGRRLYEIDLLRFVAALVVVLFHYTFSRTQASYDFEPTLGAVSQYGFLGVELFFVISGMVVLMSVWGRTTREFVASRVSRLYPAFWVAVTVTAATVASGAVSGRNGVTTWQYLANLTMFPQLANADYVENVYWTLWAEWRFYAILFAFSLIGITVQRTRWMLWAWLAASVAMEVLPVPEVLYAKLALIVQPEFSHYFIAGMALYLVHHFGATKELVVLLVACYVNAVSQTGDGLAERGAEGQTPNFLVVALIIAGIFIVMTAAACGALQWMGRPWLAHLGAMTYPLYLIHVSVGAALFSLLAPAVNVWVALLTVVLVMCGAAWLISVKFEDRVRPTLHAKLCNLLRVPRRADSRNTRSAPPQHAPADLR